MTKFFDSHPLAIVTLVVLLVALFIAALVLAYQPTMKGVEWREKTYRVQAGDSLWSISKEYCPDDVDCREWIEEVRALNGMTGSVIYKGQTLTILVPEEGR